MKFRIQEELLLSFLDTKVVVFLYKIVSIVLLLRYHPNLVYVLSQF